MEEMVEKRRWKQGLLPLHLLFLLMAIVFIVIGSIVQHWNFNIGILVTEFGMLVLPASLFMLVKKNDLKKQFRFNAPKISDLWKMVLAGIVFGPFIGLLNSMINIWLVYGLNIQPPQIPTEPGFFGPLITFMIAAMTPGFCEEFFFRGLLLTEYEKKMGYFQAALISALLFGMFHYNLMNFFGPFALGLVFAWVMQVTDSIWTAMLGHMINNSFAVVMLYLTAGADQTQNMKAVEQLGTLWPLMAVGTILFLAAIAVPCAYVSTLFLRSIRKQHLKTGDQLSMSNRNFEVVTAGRVDIVLKEIVLDYAFSEEIETTYKRLYKNKNVRLVNKHWFSKELTFKIRLKEWWPVLICAIMYIGVNVLNVMAMMADTVK
jgi:membrane protease YdiL (CAAX protease family)